MAEEKKTEAEATGPFKNVSGHPIDVDDGRVVGANEWIDLPADGRKRGPLAQAAIKAEQLIAKSTKLTEGAK